MSSSPSCISSECVGFDLYGQRLFDAYKCSHSKRERIRNSIVLTKRIVSHTLSIHPHQMDDEFARTALDNIYRAHENYKATVGFHADWIDEDREFRFRKTNVNMYNSYLFIQNTPLELYQRSDVMYGMHAYHVAEDRHIHVELEGISESCKAIYGLSVFKHSHSVIGVDNSSCVLVSKCS